jgi:hypothetical protein
MAAIAIGVSSAPPLPYLGGAVNGARAFHQWATALGYDARLVTDEDEPLTLTRLRNELQATLGMGSPPLRRLLLYFAGHGLIREAEEGLWLLSDWSSELRAVAVEALKRRLYRYGVAQIAIFADACRGLPDDIEAADLTPDAVLGRGPGPRSSVAAIDKFIATQDGTETFMVPGPTPEDDRCLFSGVLLEGLWGTKPGAFSTVVRDKVTSRSLGAYLQSEVPLVAARYAWTVVPTVSPTFPEGEDVYFGDGPRITPPTFLDWPDPERLKALSQDRHPEPLLAPALGGGPVDRAWEGDGPIAKPLHDELRDQERPSHFETGSGFAVDGEEVVAVWTTSEEFAEAHGRPNWWRVGSTTVGPWLHRAAPVLIELSSGRCAGVTALPEFIASLVVRAHGVAGLVYRVTYMGADVAAATEVALGELERGGLHADAATDLALELRQGKHADPVRGVISAYLYDAMGDVDSIRRMAFYYVMHDQPIPYDIALLAQLEGELRDGILWATVPPVPVRAPRTEREGRFRWTHSATDAGNGPVAGLWPWLRQGWALLDDPADDGTTLVLPGVMELTAHVTSARFTTLDAEGGRELARLFGLTAPAARQALGGAR